ncbi:MAG TPA: integrin alpha, partial [bacterium]
MRQVNFGKKASAILLLMVFAQGVELRAGFDLVQTFSEVNSSVEFGYSVSAAGDVNKDGYADVIVGAHKAYTYTGRAYVYYGGPAMDNTADVVLIGEGTYDIFGYSVSTAGDMN